MLRRGVRRASRRLHRPCGNHPQPFEKALACFPVCRCRQAPRWRNFRYCVWHIQEPPREVGARVNLHSTRVACFALIVLGSIALASCGGNTYVARENQCRQQVVLSLAPGVARTDREMDRLQDDTNVQPGVCAVHEPHTVRLFAQHAAQTIRVAGARFRACGRIRTSASWSRRAVAWQGVRMKPVPVVLSV